jgi:DNA anti-recombination protein RmuC
VQDQMSHVGNAIKSSSEQFNKLLIENTTKSTGILEQQTDRLDRALQEELRKSIETMGKHLAALSNKFVSDYSPLTEKLREVVRLAEDLRRGRN